MKRLCYATFAKILALCGNRSRIQGDMNQTLFNTLGYVSSQKTQSQDALASNSIAGAKPLPPELRIAAEKLEPKSFVDTFMQGIKSLINENKKKIIVLALQNIIRQDDLIDNDTVVDKVAGLTKSEIISADSFFFDDFLTGVFLYAVISVNNTVGKDSVKRIDENYIKSFEEKRAEITLFNERTDTKNTETAQWQLGDSSDVIPQAPGVITESRPLRPTDFFRGRNEKLKEIKEKLHGKAKLLLLNGMGGIGKTEICRKLFNEAINGQINEVCKVGWVTYGMNLEQTLFRQFGEIESPALKASDYLLQAQKYLNSFGGSLLLFVDNSNEMTEEEAAWLMRLECKVILTSRRRNTERLMSIEVGKLTLEDCRILYRQHFGLCRFNSDSESIYNTNYMEDSSPDENLDAIIALADRHTLAVELLAKTQRAAMYSTKQFRAILEEQGFSLSDIKEQITYVHNPEQGEWDKAEQIFIEQFSKVLDIAGISGERLRIMQLFSLLAPEAVLSADIKNWFDINSFDDMNNLVNKGWLTSGLVGDEESPGLAMHPLVSSVVRHKAMPDESVAQPLMLGLIESLGLPDEELFTTRLPFVKHAATVIDAIDGNSCEYPDLANHATNILLRISDHQKAERILLKAKTALTDISPNAATMHNNLGRVYELQGKYELALSEYEKARDMFLSTVGREHRDMATAYNNIAGVYTTLGKHKEALASYEVAAEIRLQTLGEDHPVTQITYNNMAVIFGTLGDYSRAMDLLFRNLEVSEKHLNPGHPHIAQVYGNVSEVMRIKGDYGTALKWALKASNLLENTLGKDSPDTALCYNNIGQIHSDMGNYEAALKYHEKALAIFSRVFGEDHSDSASILANIGQIYDLQGDYPKAFEAAEKALGILKGAFGDGHLRTVLAYSSLAEVYRHSGEYHKAIKLNKKALEIRENILGRFHPDVAVIYGNLSDAYNRIGNYKKAIEASEKALSIIESTVGLNHQNAAAAQNNIGNAHMLLGNYKDAEKHFKLALDINLRVLGEEHPNTASGYESIGWICFRNADYKSALDLYFRSMKIKEKTLGANHPKVANSCSSIAGVYDVLGDYDASFEWHTKAFEIRKEALGMKHPDTSSSLNSLAGIHCEKGDYAKALEQYQELLVIRETIYGQDHLSTAAACNNIAYVHDKTSDFDNALKWYLKALAIKERELDSEHPSLATSYNNIAALYCDKGKYSEAKEYYEKALAIRELKFGNNHPDSAAIYHALACVNVKQNRNNKAARLFFKAYHIRNSKLGASHRDTVDTFECLRIIYKKIAPDGLPFEDWLDVNL